MSSFKFCPKCGNVLVLKKPEGHDKEELVCESCGFIFWQNSKPTASALIVDQNNRLLLVKRAIEPHKGKWDIPGGFLELGEHPEDGVKREMKEELGIDIAINKFIGVVMDRYGDNDNAWTLNIFYEAHIASGVPTPASDVSEFKWFSIEYLPDKMAFVNNEKGIDIWLKEKDFTPKYTKESKTGNYL